MRGEGVTAGTLHSIALAQLRRRAEQRDRAMPGLLERKARLLVPIVGEGRRRGPETVSIAADVASEIEWAKARLIAADVYAAAARRLGRDPSPGIDEVAGYYARYEQSKRRARLLDFDDLLWWCGDALDTDDDFAAEQRWRFRHLFVDEFQDVSPAQLRLVRGWLGDRLDLTVVGDPDQAIFSFTGADPTGLTDFQRLFPGARLVRLDRNYRSTPQIVAAAEALLADGGLRRARRDAVQGEGPVPVITDYDTEGDEAEGVARKIRAARTPGMPWSAFAVLYRINAQSAAFEAALAAEGIPSRVRGEGRFLARPAVRAVLDAPARGRHRRSRSAAHRAPHRPRAARPRRRKADGDKAGDDGTSDGGERAQHTAAVVRLGREFDAIDPGGSVDRFITWLGTALRNEEPSLDSDAVELLTFHRAKGLEFHTVHVTGLERGLVPIARAEDPAARAEERRLLYVALTRAEHTLELSWARRRTLGSREMNRVASPWLAPIEDACTPPGEATPTEQRAARAARAELERARDRLAGGADDEDEPDPELLAALVEWRRSLARTAAVPAYVIFHDSTLKTIAASRPETRDGTAGGGRRRARQDDALRRRGAGHRARARRRPRARFRLTAATVGGMHRFDETAARAARACLDYALERLQLDPAPLDGPVPAAELAARAGQTITAEGRPPEEVLALFTEVLAPACMSTDSPRHLAFIPAAPTKTALLFDTVVAASSICATSWLEAAGAVYAENQALDVLARLAGLPADAGGCFVSGGSAGNLSALFAAREQAARQRGGRPQRWRVAVGAEAHSSVVSTLRILDCDALVVPSDDDGHLTGGALSGVLADDGDPGSVFAVVATAGTTNAGLVDDLASIAPVAREHDLWFHVDAAYGGAALFAPSVRPRFDGIEAADSMVVDPHKWLFAPFDSCALLYRDPGRGAGRARAARVVPRPDALRRRRRRHPHRPQRRVEPGRLRLPPQPAGAGPAVLVLARGARHRRVPRRGGAGAGDRHCCGRAGRGDARGRARAAAGALRGALPPHRMDRRRLRALGANVAGGADGVRAADEAPRRDRRPRRVPASAHDHRRVRRGPGGDALTRRLSVTARTGPTSRDLRRAPTARRRAARGRGCGSVR